MIPINPVNLSHLYDKFLMKKHNLTFFVFLRVFFYKGQLFVNLLSGTHFWSVPTPCIMALGQLAQSSRSRKFFRIKIPATHLIEQDVAGGAKMRYLIKLPYFSILFGQPFKMIFF